MNKIHPFKCPTIASYCMRVFRTNFMNDNQICVLKKDEYDFVKRGFFGGRTEVFKLFKSWTDDDIKNGKYGKYVDICSLYPTVQYFDYLPCGIPIWKKEMINENIVEYLENNFGFHEVDIECPKNLYIPLLPEKKDCKLIFDLKDKSNSVYSSIELLEAIRIGYKISKITKSLCFNKNNDMFKEYVRAFLKLKTEASGYDGDNIDNYISSYKIHCGIDLDKDKIVSNNGKKLLAKICLNSLWGKFGQKDDMPTTKYVNSDNWFRLLDKHKKGKIELKNETLIDSETLYVTYIEKDAENTSLITTNLALAAFVTANARLRLFKELNLLGDRAIYCDTDSIIYEYDKTKYNVTEGDMLGQWELEEYKDLNGKKHEGNLREIYALAPKTYGVKTLTDYSSVKCKGITLNYNNSNLFNYDTLSKLIKGEILNIRTYTDDFIKDKKNGIIYTKQNVEKIIGFDRELTKRIFREDGTSSPYQ
jgi:hypothetical protein